MAVIRFDQVSAPVQQQHANAIQGSVGQSIANEGQQANRSLAGLAATLYHVQNWANHTQQAINDAGAVKDADDAYFGALGQIAEYKRDVADGTRDSRGFFKDVLDPANGILAKAWQDGERAHYGKQVDTQSPGTFTKQLVNRFHPLREKLMMDWTNEAIKQTKDGIDSATTLFNTSGSMLATPWGTAYEAKDLVNDFIGLRDRVQAGVRGGALTQEAGTKHLQDTLVSTVLARQSRIYKEDPLNADARVANEMQQITPLLDSTHQLSLNEARQKGELSEKNEVERQLQRNLELGIMPIDHALQIAQERGLDPKKLYDAQVGGMKARNDIASEAFKENDRFAEARSKTLADSYEQRVLNEKGFSFESEMRDSTKFYKMRDEERKRVFAFQKTIREASDNLKSDTGTLDRIIGLVYTDPDSARSAILGTVGKTLSKSDAEELLKLRATHVEKLKDKNTSDTHAQYVNGLNDMEERLKTVGGGSTESDPIAIEVRAKYTQTYRRMMYDPESSTMHGDEMQNWLERINGQAVTELKRRTAEEGLKIINKYRIYDTEGQASYAKVAQLKQMGILSELEAKRAKDYIDIQAHEPHITSKPTIKPKNDKGIGRKFERVIE